MSQLETASLAIAEMREFAEFDAAEQRYIRRSLDVGLARADAYRLWARSPEETVSIRRQYRAYEALPDLRASIPDLRTDERIDGFMGALITVTLFDLATGSLHAFAPYRFLYERLLAPSVRPWLPAAFCAAAALPQIDPERRKQLLHSLSESVACAPGWSRRRPRFYPEFIECEAPEAEV